MHHCASRKTHVRKPGLDVLYRFRSLFAYDDDPALVIGRLEDRISPVIDGVNI